MYGGGNRENNTHRALTVNLGVTDRCRDRLQSKGLKMREFRETVSRDY